MHLTTFFFKTTSLRYADLCGADNDDDDEDLDDDDDDQSLESCQSPCRSGG